MIERKKDNEIKKQETKQIKQSDNSIINSYNNTKGRVIKFEKRSQNKILPDFIARNVVIIVRQSYNEGIRSAKGIYDALDYITNSIWYKNQSIQVQYAINHKLVIHIVRQSILAKKKKC